MEGVGTMSTVANINAYRQASQPAHAPTETEQFFNKFDNGPLDFVAYERPLWYEGATGTRYSNTGHKALVRMKDGTPTTLNVVRETYKVVQNRELFDAIHSGLLAALEPRDLIGAQIKDKIAYDGTQCFREYIFPNVRVESPERDNIMFRVIVQNGFGTGAIKLFSGAIDAFCWNGMVIGEYTRTYAKHTKGVQISKFDEAVRGSIHMFWKQRDLYKELAGKKVLDPKLVEDFFTHNFGDRLGARLYHQYQIEATKRGYTLWAVYSAMTHYASHADDNFPTRNTGNDHLAATMMKRENDVRNAVAAKSEFWNIAA